MKGKKASRVLAYALTAAMLASSFTAAPKASAASGKYVKSLKVKKKVTVSVNSKVTVKPAVKVANKATKMLAVKVKDKKIVKAVYSAKKQIITITGKKTGKTTVTVTTKGKNNKGKKLSAKITVNVTAGNSEKVTASPAVSTAVPVTTAPVTTAPVTTASAAPVQTTAPVSTADVIIVPSPTPTATATHYDAVNVKGNVVDVYAQNGIYSVNDLSDYSSAQSRTKTVRTMKRLKGAEAKEQESSDSGDQEKPEETKSDNVQDAKVYLIPNADDQLDVNNLPEDAIETATDANGDYKFEQVSCGDYCLVIQKEKYKTAIQYITLGSLQPDYQMESMYVLDETIAAAVQGRITGTIVDATNKEPIKGLTVELRHNKGNTFGTAYMTTTTDADGVYTFGSDEELLEADQYTVYVKDERELESEDDRHYISNIMNTCVFNNTPTSLDIAMTKPLSASDGAGIRFVLQWGSEGQDGVPADVDSHLYGPRAVPAGDYEGDLFHVYFGSRNYGAGDAVYANLDVDDMDYEGPETITLTRESDGIYHYYVYNYSGTESLAMSKATVKVYVGDSLEPLTVYNVPSSNGNELWWKVCSYNSRTHELISYNVLEEENSLDDSNLNGYYLGYESGLVSVSAANPEDLDSYYFSSADQIISIYGYVPWSTMKDEIQYELKPGYTVSFKEVDETTDSAYKGDLVFTYDDISYKYPLYYCYEVSYDYDIRAEGDSLATYSYYEDSLSLYFAVDTEENLGELVRNLNFVSSNENIKVGDLEFDDEEDYGHIPLYEAETGEFLQNVYLYAYAGRYLSSVTYEGESIEFYESSSYIDVYGDSDVGLEKYSYHCADGFTATVVEDDGSQYLQVQDSTGTVVSEKRLYMEEEWDW